MVLPRLPRAVVFDMDGLLFDTEKLYRAGVVAAVTPMAANCRRRSCPRSSACRETRSRTRSGPSWARISTSTSLWQLARRHVDDLIEAELRLKAGVIELLDALDARKMPRAIATSSRHETVERYLATQDFERPLRRGHRPGRLRPRQAASRPLSQGPPRCWESIPRTVSRSKIRTPASAPPPAAA